MTFTCHVFGMCVKELHNNSRKKIFKHFVLISTEWNPHLLIYTEKRTPWVRDKNHPILSTFYIPDSTLELHTYFLI